MTMHQEVNVLIFFSIGPKRTVEKKKKSQV